MASWFTHLQLSPYCHANYPILWDKQGRDVCPCGWVGSKVVHARLDADRKARPLSEIIAHHRAGDCFMPGISAEEYEYRTK